MTLSQTSSSARRPTSSAGLSTQAPSTTNQVHLLSFSGLQLVRKLTESANKPRAADKLAISILSGMHSK